MVDEFFRWKTTEVTRGLGGAKGIQEGTVLRKRWSGGRGGVYGSNEQFRNKELLDG